MESEVAALKGRIFFMTTYKNHEYSHASYGGELLFDKLRVW